MSAGNNSPWMVVREAAEYCRCSEKTIYRAVDANQLKAARVGGRRALRFRAEHLDHWLDATVPQEGTPSP